MAGQILAFGPFRAQIDNEQLWCGSEWLRLTPKAFAVLKCLLASPAQLVTKETLLDIVWPETYVSEAALAVCIRELRQALGDSAKAPQYIETAYRRGYRFIAPIRVVDDAPQTSDASPVSQSILLGREAELNQLRQWYTAALPRYSSDRVCNRRSRDRQNHASRCFYNGRRS